MSGEVIAIVTVGVAFAGVLVGLFAWLRQDLTPLRTELRDNIRQLADRVGRLEERVARIEHSQAKLEGLLEGLREAITGRVAG